MSGLDMVGGLAIGALIAGKYRIERVLGKGGMGVVVAATHVELLEPRAIKLMTAATAADPELAQRFMREARIASRLRSEHAVKVYDIGRLDHGVPYMVMEHLEGSDLRTLRRRHGTLPVEEVALYVIQLCDALAEAHAQGLVHRDIKPSNVFLTHGPDGAPCVKLLDFGISKIADKARGEQEGMRTGTGQILGTPHFMPPEQMLGQRDIDARADIWALGVLIYVLITGRYPVNAGPVDVVRAVLSGEFHPPPLSQVRPDLPRGLDDVVLGCIQIDRERRPPNVAELARALAPYAPLSGNALVERIGRVLGVPWVEPVRYVSAFPQGEILDDSVHSLVQASSEGVALNISKSKLGLDPKEALTLPDLRELEALVLAESTNPGESTLSLPTGAAMRTVTRLSIPLASTMPPRSRASRRLFWGCVVLAAAAVGILAAFLLRSAPPARTRPALTTTSAPLPVAAAVRGAKVSASGAHVDDAGALR